MDYVIKNHKSVYIRLNQNGKPVTCAKQDATKFEHSKALNVLDNLPKTLKRLKFIVEPIPDIICKVEESGIEAEKRVLSNQNFKVSDELMQWIDKFGICDDILKEAEKRKEELNTELSNIDKEFSNLINEIELEGKIDLYG